MVLCEWHRWRCAAAAGGCAVMPVMYAVWAPQKLESLSMGAFHVSATFTGKRARIAWHQVRH